MNYLMYSRSSPSSYKNPDAHKLTYNAISIVFQTLSIYIQIVLETENTPVDGKLL